MKKIYLIPLLLLALLLTPVSALAAPSTSEPLDDVVIFGEDYVLAAGETVDGSVLVFGGDVTLETGSTVDLDVVSFGGDIEINGNVSGSVISLGGDVTLGDAAIVQQDVTTFGGDLDRAAGAQIVGNTFSDMRGFNFNFPGDFSPPDFQFDRTGPRQFFGQDDGFGHNILWLLFTAFAMSTFGLLVALFVPDQLRRTASAILAEPVLAGGLGWLSLILLPFVLLITLITIIGPVILGFVATIAVAFGWIALGLEVGRRLGVALKGSWSPVVQAWIGTLVISLVAGFLGWIPCLGVVGQVTLASIGLGGVILTRFGTRTYPDHATPARKQLPPPGGPRKRAARTTKK